MTLVAVFLLFSSLLDRTRQSKESLTDCVTCGSGAMNGAVLRGFGEVSNPSAVRDWSDEPQVVTILGRGLRCQNTDCSGICQAKPSCAC